MAGYEAVPISFSSDTTTQNAPWINIDGNFLLSFAGILTIFTTALGSIAFVTFEACKIQVHWQAGFPGEEDEWNWYRALHEFSTLGSALLFSLILILVALNLYTRCRIPAAVVKGLMLGNAACWSPMVVVSSWMTLCNYSKCTTTYLFKYVSLISGTCGLIEGMLLFGIILMFLSDGVGKREFLRARTRKLMSDPGHTLLSFFPLFLTLRNYRLSWVGRDFIAGIIAACFHIPQSMGTGMAANLGPLYGLYLTFFPGLIYAFLGSSPHNSVGAFAPSAALVGVGIARTRMMFESGGLHKSYEIVTVEDRDRVVGVHMEIAVSIAFCAGIIQILLSFCKFGFIHRLFPSNVLDPFNCACSLQIMLVQIPNMFGVPLNAYFGLCKHIQMIVLLLQNITAIQWFDTLLAVISASIIIGFREFLQPPFFRRLHFVLPIEFIVMVVSMILSYYLDLSGNHSVRMLWKTPIGIPPPSVPKFQYMPYEFFEGFLGALVSIAFLMQAAKVIARKQDYSVSSNQELLALGSANVFSSFFSCYISSALVGRNVVLESMGSRSQLSTLFSSLFTGLLLAFASKTLFYLPLSVIATIITLTLAMSLKLMWDIPKLLKGSTIDGAVWIVTFVACVLLDLEWGLLLGLVISWFTILYKSQKLCVTVLGRTQRSSNLYVPMKSEKETFEISGIAILQILNGLHFENAERFLRFTLHKIKVESEKIRTQREETYNSFNGEVVNMQMSRIGSSNENSEQLTKPPLAERLHHLILDFSMVTFIDSTGLKALEQLISVMQKKHINLLVAHCNDSIEKQFRRCGLLIHFQGQEVSQTVQEAVNRALTSIENGIQIGGTESQHEPPSGVEEGQERFWAPPGIPIEGLETAEDPESENLQS